jgi:osmotically-inducible protein OsmY
MKIRKIILLLSFVILTGCVGYSSSGILGTGVSIALDPRSLGTQIDDSIMQQNLRAKLLSADKSYLISVKTKILDGRIFLTGKVNTVEDKLKITKLAWEIKGARSVKNDLRIKEDFNFKRSAKDLLLTSQLRTAMIGNKKIKSVNYSIDTYKKKIYIYGIAQNKTERDEVTKEAEQILDVEEVITSIFLVDDLRVVKK